MTNPRAWKSAPLSMMIVAKMAILAARMTILVARMTLKEKEKKVKEREVKIYRPPAGPEAERSHLPGEGSRLH